MITEASGSHGSWLNQRAEGAGFGHEAVHLDRPGRSDGQTRGMKAPRRPDIAGIEQVIGVPRQVETAFAVQSGTQWYGLTGVILGVALREVAAQ